MSIDSGPFQPVMYGDTRTDVATAFPGLADSTNASGAVLMDTTTLTNGLHQIGWLVTDSCGRQDGVGSRFLTVLNGTSGDSAGEQRPSANGEGRPDIGAARSAARPSGTPHTGTALPHQSEALPANPGAVYVRQLGGDWQEVRETVDGSRVVEVPQGGRIEIQLPLPASGAYDAFQEIDGQRRPLPLGSSFDAKAGIFYWQPAPAFFGSFGLVFQPAAGDLVRLRLIVKNDSPAVRQLQW